MESQAPTHPKQDNINLNTTEQYENRYRLLDHNDRFVLMEMSVSDSDSDEEHIKAREEFMTDIIHNLEIQINKPD